MKFLDALAIVRDLAHENVLEEYFAQAADLKEERERQIISIEVVDGFIDMLISANSPREYPCGHPVTPGDDICSNLFCSSDGC